MKDEGEEIKLKPLISRAHKLAEEWRFHPSAFILLLN